MLRDTTPKQKTSSVRRSLRYIGLHQDTSADQPQGDFQEPDFCLLSLRRLPLFRHSGVLSLLSIHDPVRLITGREYDALPSTFTLPVVGELHSGMMKSDIMLERALTSIHSAAREIVEDIKHGAGENYGAEKLSELCKLLPDREEEKRLRSFQGERSCLEEPDLFMLLLVQLPSFRLRLDAMILKEEFDPAVTSLHTATRCLREAAIELRSCSELHSILRLVLRAGNYMNAGSYAGNAAGFRIASLLKLADTKANKPGMNLLHFVAMEVVKKDQSLLTFPCKLAHIAEASRFSEEVVQEDLSRLHSQLVALQANIQAEPDIQQQTQNFTEAAEEKLREMDLEVEALRSDSQALVDFFCEDESSFKLEEACRVFHNFCLRFQKAVQENAERKLKEQRRAEREREIAEKRRSIATCTGLELGQGSDELEHTLERTLSSALQRRVSQRYSQHSNIDASLKRLSTDASTDITHSQQRQTVEGVHSQHGSIDVVLHAEKTCANVEGGQEHSPDAQSCLLATDLSDGLLTQPADTPAPPGSAQLLRLVSERMLVRPAGPVSPQRTSPVPPAAGKINRQPNSSEPQELPRVIQGASLPATGKERMYSRVGETLECLTLVRGLRSYESLTVPVQRAPPSHCSKWRKEREAGEKDGAGPLQGKDDSRAGKDSARGSRKGPAPRTGTPTSAGAPRVRTKPDPPSPEETSARASRLPVTRSTSARPTTNLRPTSTQPQIKRANSMGDKGHAVAEQAAKASRHLSEDTKQEKEKASVTPFLRGSPMRLSRRVAPNAESSTRTPLSPSSTTAKTIRASVIAAAAVKAAKASESGNPRTQGSRLSGPKVARPSAQPMW
ncbi:FH2 domain-containing protein 1-like, partial [Scleropages formosus]